MDKVGLRFIQNDVIKYANIISNVLDVDVEIVDESLYRIAGTGMFKDKINQNIANEGYIYSNIIDTGDTHIIQNPGYHPLCQKCKKKEHCDEKLEISMPIKFNSKIIGVIGLISTDEEQKNQIVKKLDSHIAFLSQIAEFITSRMFQFCEMESNRKSIEVLKEIIDNVDKGILMIDDKDRIIHMNSSAMKQLNLNSKYINETILIESRKEFIINSEEYNVQVGDHNFELLGQLIPISYGFLTCSKVFMFNQIRKLKSDAYMLTNSSRNIKVEDILGKSEVINRIKQNIIQIAKSNSTVSITGESGTGKELIARSIHWESSRKNNPFIAINCGAIPDSLIESELFGYVKGAFSGASENGRIGKFEQANRGTIFLDEIGDMPLHLQVKLLRVVQEKKVVRIGSNKPVDIDIRIVAASNKDLKELIQQNKFREDLYYRLNVIPIYVPPLRERKEDINLLLNEMIQKYNYLLNKFVQTIEKDARDILIRYPWPGNVRELQNAIEYMINLADERGVLTKYMIPKTILDYFDNENSTNEKIENIKSLETLEKEYIKKALDIYGWDTVGKQLAAKKLGIGIATLYRKLKEYR